MSTVPSDPAPAKATALGPLMSICVMIFLTVYLIVIYGVLIYVEYELWRNVGDHVSGNVVITLPLLGISRSISSNSWMILMVLVTGAIGSFIHAATSLATFIGLRKADGSWLTWYILRPLIGSALAFVLYLLMRGGFLNASNDTASFNLYGFAGIAGLSGMFAKQATQKLSEVFDTFFQPKPSGNHNAGAGSATPTPPPPPTGSQAIVPPPAQADQQKPTS